MYSEEETELRDLIIQNLESCGFLNKIKAELRAGVFLALEEDGNLKNRIPLFNKKFDDFASTTRGKLLLSVVREFLEYFNLPFTLSVFDPEIAVSSPCISRSELCKEFNIDSEINGPVLSELIKDKIIDENQNPAIKSTEELQPVAIKTLKPAIIKSTLEENIVFNEKYAFEKNQPVHGNLEKEHYVAKYTEDDVKETLKDSSISSKPFSENLNKTYTEKTVTDIAEIKSTKDNILKEPKDILSPDHDPFFDEPLPSEKPSFFSFTETFKDKSENKFPFDVKRGLDESKKVSLSSLKDLPSLTTNNEWTFSRDPKSTFSSLESQKSISSSEASNEEIINLDSRESFQKKDSDIAESNEESSEKQISEESIEEEIEEIEDDSMSAGLEDILNSSMSLAEDNTTDQTISQTSVVEGVDHVEPCK